MTNPAKADARRRAKFYKNMQRSVFYKSIVQNQNLPLQVRLFAQEKIGKDESIVKIQNRCILTGRGRGVYRFCKLSRIKLKEKASAGALMGVSKTSW